MNVLFVCTGNLCRSPMAEGLFRVALERRGCTGVRVTSSGTWAYTGSSPTPEAIDAAGEYDADISGYESIPLTRAQLDESDVVVAMTSVHLREIADHDPDARRKVFLMKELAEIEPALAPGAGIDGLTSGRRPPWRRSLDLDDPIGLPLGAYRRCARQIHEATELLADVLCGPAPAAST